MFSKFFIGNNFMIFSTILNMNLLSLISNLVIFMLVVISKHVLNIGSFDPNPIRKIHDMIWILSPTYCRQLASMEDLPIISETLISESDSDPPSTCPQGSPEHPAAFRAESKPTELLRALEVVERDSVAIAESFTSLFASLRLALSEVSFGIVEIVGDCCWVLSLRLVADKIGEKKGKWRFGSHLSWKFQFSFLVLVFSQKGESEFLITGLLCCSIVWWVIGGKERKFQTAHFYSHWNLENHLTRNFLFFSIYLVQSARLQFSFLFLISRQPIWAFAEI